MNLNPIDWSVWYSLHTHRDRRHIKTHTPHKYEGIHSPLGSLLSLVSGDTAPTEQPGSISAEHDFRIIDWQFLYKRKGEHLCTSAGVYMRVLCVYNACLSRRREDVKETEREGGYSYKEMLSSVNKKM